MTRIAMGFALLAGATAGAEDAVVTTTAEKEPSRVSVMGFLDGYNSFRAVEAPHASSELRVFDASNGGPALAYAELALAVTPKPVGLRVDVGFGQIADVGYLELSQSAPAAVNAIARHIQQAFVTAEVGGVTIDAGKFVGTVGAEVIESRDDWNYSRSLLFNFAQPLTHTGLRATVHPTDAFTVQAALTNGWDSVIGSNAMRTAALTLGYTFKSGMGATVTALTGPEGEKADRRTLIDAVITQTLNDKAQLSLNADFGRERQATWFGASLSGRYSPREWLNLSARAELFSDPDGARLAVLDGTQVVEGTVTVGVPVMNHAELRAEVRHDIATRAVFDGGKSPTQTTAELAALAYF